MGTWGGGGCMGIREGSVGHENIGRGEGVGEGEGGTWEWGI
jgi:hypothetical protein